MRGRTKAWPVWLLLTCSMGSLACDDEESGVLGKYTAVVFEDEDTCDNERDGPYTIQLEIARQGEGFSVEVNGAGPLTGDFRDDGILAVIGTVTGGDPPCDGAGACPRQVQLEMDIRRGQIVQGAGRVTWNGTFPDVPGVCVQDLVFTGSRQALTPLVGSFAFDAVQG